MKAATPFLFLMLCSAVPANAACETQTLSFTGVARVYALCVPAETKAKMPVLLLLHGSGGNGAGIAALWEIFAAREGIILVAPDALHSEAWHLKEDGPDFLHAIINDIQTRYTADRRRLYLFGQSGGAVHALTLAMLESQYFAAMAIHAGTWRSAPEFKAMQLAQRKIPLKIIIGDRDEYFSASSVRRTENGLKTAGFRIDLEIVPGQHHGFIPEIAAATEASAWRFLEPIMLPQDPIFVQYGNGR